MEFEEHISLQHVLQLMGFAHTGGEAKRLIQDGHVQVNGQLETRRKRKLLEGDLVVVGDEEFVLELVEDIEED